MIKEGGRMRKGVLLVGLVSLVLLVQLVFVGNSFTQANQGGKGEKEAEQALQDFKEVMEGGKETKSFEESEKVYEEGARARNRLLKLGKLATPVLVRTIKAKKLNEHFRHYCISLLISIQDEKTIEPLIELYRDESETPGIRYGALYALGKIGRPRVLRVLLEALSNSESKIRRGVVHGIWALAGRKIVDLPVDEIVEIAKNDPNISIRATATAALKLGGEQAVLPLLELMNDEYDNIRLQACKALGLIEDRRAVEPLLARLNDKNAYERMAVILALGDIGDRRAVDTLIKILKERGPSNEPALNSGYAAKALAEIGDERAIEPLKRAIEDMEMWEQEVKKQTGESMYPDKWFTKMGSD